MVSVFLDSFLWRHQMLEPELCKADGSREIRGQMFPQALAADQLQSGPGFFTATAAVAFVRRD